MDRHLNIVFVGDREAGVDRRWGRPPILVQLQATGARCDLQPEGTRRAVPFAEEPDG